MKIILTAIHLYLLTTLDFTTKQGKRKTPLYDIYFVLYLLKNTEFIIVILEMASVLDLFIVLLDLFIRHNFLIIFKPSAFALHNV